MKNFNRKFASVLSIALLFALLLCAVACGNEGTAGAGTTAAVTETNSEVTTADSGAEQSLEIGDPVATYNTISVSIDAANYGDNCYAVLRTEDSEEPVAKIKINDGHNDVVFTSLNAITTYLFVVEQDSYACCSQKKVITNDYPVATAKIASTDSTADSVNANVTVDNVSPSAVEISINSAEGEVSRKILTSGENAISFTGLKANTEYTLRVEYCGRSLAEQTVKTKAN